MPYLHAGNDLWRRIREAGMGCVSVMGLAKNTGKTVTLNLSLIHISEPTRPY